MKIVVSTPGRFHSFELAAQLELAGVLDRIFTGYPLFRLRNEAVSRKNVVSVSAVHAPLMAAYRLPFQSAWASPLSELHAMACDRLDKVVKRSLGDADTLIALSGSGLYSGLQLQRHGGVYICDRGSTHILFQEQILREEADIVGLPRQQINDHVIMKELAEYAAADAILTPSIFTLATFLARGIPREKLMLVPYGINTKTFSPRLPKSPHFSVLFAGQTTYRKGIHYLLKAWRQWRPANAELRIAGSRSAEFDALAAWAGGLPPGVTLLGHLDRQTLANEMATAHALIMPSIEEGLPLVMAQAMACGTPVIATVNSGAETLFEHGKSGLIGHARSVDFLVESLEQLAHHSGMASALAAAAVTRSANFGSARAYGQRVLAALETTKTRRGL